MNVYVNQFNTHTGINLLPLAAGLLIANARSDALVARSFQFNLCVRREPPEQIARAYVQPRVLAYSCYMWNIQHSLSVAAHVKLLHPLAVNVFGGPSIPREPAAIRQFLMAHPQVDILGLGEGEALFRDLLRVMAEDGDLVTVPGIAFRDPGEPDGIRITAPRARIRDLSALRSPFLDGTFDQLMRTERAGITGALWETNRGCPFSCSFCDWGQATHSRVEELSRERLGQELRWIAHQQLEFCWAADANFGIRPRDLEIARDIAAIHAETGFPRFFQVSWTKNSSHRVIEIAATLAEAGIRSPITLSTQSFHDPTLDAVRRRNIKLTAFSELKRHFNARGIQTYTEIILGLPEETYDSFCQGLLAALSMTSTDFVIVYLCRLLENTEMAAPAARDRHGLQTRLCRLEIPRRTGLYESVTEYEEIVVGTNTLPRPDWERAFDFGYLLCALYNQRLADVVLNFLRSTVRVDPKTLLEWVIRSANAQNAPTLHTVLDTLSQYRRDILRGDPAVRPLEGFGEYLWEPQEACYLIAARSPVELLQELQSLCRDYLGFANISFDSAMLTEVFDFQTRLVPDFRRPNGSLASYQWAWDRWSADFDRDGPLPNTSGTDKRLRFIPPEMKESTVEEFLSQQVRVTRSGTRTTCTVINEPAPSP